METITAVGLIIIGIAIGFILTKGFQLNKEIKNKKMSTLPIINTEIEQTTPVCHAYSVTVNGNSGDDVTIYYTDCEGVVRETTSYASGGTLNVPITASACARVGTATSSRGVLTDEGPCN